MLHIRGVGRKMAMKGTVLGAKRGYGTRRFMSQVCENSRLYSRECVLVYDIIIVDNIQYIVYSIYGSEQPPAGKSCRGSNEAKATPLELLVAHMVRVLELQIPGCC